MQMLRHVDNVRMTSLPKSKNLFAQDSIIACLVHVQQTCGEQCKSRFTELFALADESDDEVLLRDIRSTRKRNKPSNITSHKRDSDQSRSSSSSEEEDFRRKRKQKRRQKDSSDSD